MKWYLYLLFFFIPAPIFCQTTALTHLEIVLVGPKNTDRHHPAQRKYYEDYYAVLIEELDLWISELEGHQKAIKRKNKRRIKRKKPIRLKDVPRWNANVSQIKGLKEDKKLVENYLEKWNQSFEKSNALLAKFQARYLDSICYDLITPELVLSPKEYAIMPYTPKENVFEWREFLPETVFNYRKLVQPASTKMVRRKLRNCKAPNPEDCYREVEVLVPAEFKTINCPEGYDWNGNSCYKNFEVPTQQPVDASIIIMYLPKTLPVVLDGWRKVKCPKL